MFGEVSPKREKQSQRTGGLRTGGLMVGSWLDHARICCALQGKFHGFFVTDCRSYISVLDVSFGTTTIKCEGRRYITLCIS